MSKSKPKPILSIFIFKEKVESSFYLSSKTRLYLPFAVGYESKHPENPTKPDIKLIKCEIINNSINN